MKPYPPGIARHMVNLYHSLSEKDRRRYAAVEAFKLGHGGAAYIADLFGCSPDTIRQGLADVEELPDDAAGDRVRKKGGRKTASAVSSERVSRSEDCMSIRLIEPAINASISRSMGPLITTRAKRLVLQTACRCGVFSG